jgi:hypothetical protein
MIVLHQEEEVCSEMQHQERRYRQRQLPKPRRKALDKSGFAGLAEIFAAP